MSHWDARWAMFPQSKSENENAIINETEKKLQNIQYIY